VPMIVQLVWLGASDPSGAAYVDHRNATPSDFRKVYGTVKENVDLFVRELTNIYLQMIKRGVKRQFKFVHVMQT
jgi:hypothetical protein